MIRGPSPSIVRIVSFAYVHVRVCVSLKTHYVFVVQWGISFHTRTQVFVEKEGGGGGGGGAYSSPETEPANKMIP